MRIAPTRVRGSTSRRCRQWGPLGLPVISLFNVPDRCRCTLVVVVPAKAIISRWLILIFLPELATCRTTCLISIEAPLELVVVVINSALLWVLKFRCRPLAYLCLSTYCCSSLPAP